MVEFRTVKTVKHDSVAESPVSHNAEIVKKVILANGTVDNITQMSQATLQPGQATSPHIHRDMTEIYSIYSGAAEFTVDGVSQVLDAPATTVIYPGEEHSVANTTGEPVVLHYVGVLSKELSND